MSFVYLYNYGGRLVSTGIRSSEAEDRGLHGNEHREQGVAGTGGGGSGRGSQVAIVGVAAGDRGARYGEGPEPDESPDV